MEKFRQYSYQKYSLSNQFPGDGFSQSCEFPEDFNRNKTEDERQYTHIFQQLESLPRATLTYLEKRDSPCVEKKAINKKRAKPAYLACHVCGDSAPNHCHYGGIACFSCRAFFRRSVPKARSYVCTNSQPCTITVNTRKNCQKCRFEKCVVTGMKASWVLSDEERLTRLEKKRQNRESRNKNRRAASIECTDQGSDSSYGSRPSSHESYESHAIPSILGRRSPSKLTNKRVTAQEAHQICQWQASRDEARTSIALSDIVQQNIARISQSQDALEAYGIVEFFKVP